MKLGVCLLWAEAATDVNSLRLRSRTFLGKEGIDAENLFSCYGNRKTLSTFGATALDNQSAVFG